MLVRQTLLLLGQGILLLWGSTGCFNTGENHTRENPAETDLVPLVENAGVNDGLIAPAAFKTGRSTALLMRIEGDQFAPMPLPIAADLITGSPDCYGFDVTGDGLREIIALWQEQEECRIRVYQANDHGVYRPCTDLALAGCVHYEAVWLESLGLLTVHVRDAEGLWRVYGLTRDADALVEMGSGIRHGRRDLNGDGLPEWCFLRRHNDVQLPNMQGKDCLSSVMAWDLDSRAFVPLWPAPDARFVLLSAQLCDVDGDGRDDIVALIDPDRNKALIPRLRIYRWLSKDRGFETAAEVKVFSRDLFLRLVDVRVQDGTAVFLVDNGGRYEKYEYGNGVLSFSNRL